MDEHFGDWCILPLSQHPGVIRIKANPTTTNNVARLLMPFLAHHRNEDIRDRLVILAPSGERWIATYLDNP
jgi:hypothetical protein